MKQNEKVPKKCRYRYKLNMMEPGIRMCAVIGILALFAFLFYCFHLNLLAQIAISLAGIILFILLTLIIIEQHQDHMLYLDAKKEDPDIK